MNLGNKKARHGKDRQLAIIRTSRWREIQVNGFADAWVCFRTVGAIRSRFGCVRLGPVGTVCSLPFSPAVAEPDALLRMATLLFQQGRLRIFGSWNMRLYNIRVFLKWRAV